MRRRGWVLGSARLAGLATTAWSNRGLLSRIDAADRRADAARVRLAPLPGSR